MSGIVLWSDPHFANRTSFGKIETNSEFPGCNSRFHEIAKSFRKAVDYAEGNDCESIFILGDIFHDRGVIDIPVYNAVYQLFKEAAGRGVRVVIYPGNHDMVDLRAMHVNKHLHSLFTYEKITHVQEKPSIVQTAYFPVAVIPYSNSSREVVETSKRLLDQMSGDIKILMLHHSVNGAITGPHEWVMPHRLDADDLPEGYTHIFSGHYHCHQKVKRLWYVGAPLHHDFGERTYTPGFIHVKPDGSWTQIENTDSPRFQVIETCDPKVLKTINPKDYTSIKWDGDFNEVELAKEDMPDNSIIEVTHKTKTSVRTNIQTTDQVETMIEKYAEAKYGKVVPAGDNHSSEIIDYGVRLYKGKQ